MAFTVNVPRWKRFVISETPLNGHNVLAELDPGGDADINYQIGRASCRERV